MNKQRLKKTIRLIRDLKKDYQEQTECYRTECYRTECYRTECYRTECLGKEEYKIRPKIEAWKALLAVGFTPIKAEKIFRIIQ